ncbi:class IV adenylate cyclase [Halorarius litoreus]|uniref:class IV adenylate cyclase n=1 Tax=Halorarius litoreus TaxID=2962676 RepID=UPI0020CC99D7|nr:class IV adenylate cyclase [Halorarius litoreus]
MYEVELKVEADHDAVRARLDELGATHDGRVQQVDTYYDAPHRNFAETDEAFRLRREHDEAGETAKLTYKGPLVEVESKTREEHEVEVDDGEEAAAIADGLGFTPAATVEKDREFYRLDGYTVTLDSVEGLGTYVEVETEVETDIEPAREGAKELLRRLDLDPDEQVRTSYLGLLLAS